VSASGFFEFFFKFFINFLKFLKKLKFYHVSSWHRATWHYLEGVIFLFSIWSL